MESEGENLSDSAAQTGPAFAPWKGKTSFHCAGFSNRAPMKRKVRDGGGKTIKARICVPLNLANGEAYTMRGEI
jgi:hypothetical protein